MLLLLAACQSPKVATEGPPAQGAPTEVFGPDDEEMFGPVVPGDVALEDLDAPIRIGLLLPLSGAHARLGEAMLNAAQLALFDIAGDRFELVVRDTGGTPAGAEQAANSALQEGVRLILGPVFATSVATMADEARSAEVNVIAFSNDRSVAGDGIFVMGLGPRPQIERLVGYAGSQGLQRIAVLAPDTPYGRAVIEAAREATARNGAELARVVSYQAETVDLSPEVRALADYDARREALLEQRQLLAARDDEAAKLALKRLDGLETLGAPDFQAVILPEGGKRAQAIAPLLAYFDIDPAEVRFLGTAAWAEDPQLAAEPALNGAWFTAPPPDLWSTFRERYREAFGQEPLRIASLGYDATALAAVLTRRALDAGQEPVFDETVLAQPSGFSGIDGVFRFLPSGEVERTLAVLEMRRNGARVLDPAPRSFRQLVN